MHRGEIRRFSRLVIETTGLADPVPILATLTADPMLKFHFRLGNVITVVDVPNGAGNIGKYDESARQVAVADRIVISKADLAGATELAALRRRLAAMNPAADIVVLDETSDPADALLLDVAHDLTERPADAMRWVAAEVAHSHHDHHDHHHHDVNQHGGIRAFVIEGETPVAWPRFALWLSMLVHCHGQAMLRLKGLVDVEGAETPLVIQGVQHLIHKPAHLKAWPDGVQRTRIVVIGQGLDQALVQRSFEDFNFRRRRALSA
jgi:G3E family GTPase